MSLSINLQHLNDHPSGVDLAGKKQPDAPQHWVDYLLNVLEETGEELPGKNLQPRIIKAEFRKKKTACATVAHPTYAITHPRKIPAGTYRIHNDIIPVPGYYASLSLLYVF